MILPIDVQEDALHAPYSDVTPADVERVEGQMLQWSQVEIPLKHSFAPHVYLREVFMPKGTFVLGQQHKTEHFNIVLTGKALVMMDGVVHQITAPDTFVSKPGIRKILYIIEDMRWQTIHPTENTDLEALEEELIVKSQTFLAHEEMLAFQNGMHKLLKENN